MSDAFKITTILTVGGAGCVAILAAPTIPLTMLATGATMGALGLVNILVVKK